MSIRTILVILLALICGLSAAWGMSQLGRSKFITRQPEKASIVVATVTIPRGRTLTEGDLTICKWPKEMIPETALTSLDDVVQRATIIPIIGGEPILEVKLAPKGAGAGMAALIPHGMRAYTIQSSRIGANVAGFILPGNRVDVLMTLKGRPNDGTGGGSTTTLLQAVEILAVDQELTAPAENKVDLKNLRSVTLLVTPEQASLLDLGQNMGQLSLSLRNPGDGDEAITRPATLADIRFRQEKPVEVSDNDGSTTTLVAQGERRPEVFHILTLRGSQRGRFRLVSANARERDGEVRVPRREPGNPLPHRPRLRYVSPAPLGLTIS